MMKPNSLFIFIFLFWSSAHAAEVSAAKKTSEQYGAVTVNEESSLSKILTVPGVKDVYKKCKTDHPLALDEIPNCIWGQLNDSQKEQVKTLYAQDDKNKSRAPASVNSALKTNLTEKKINIGIDYKTDPTVKALSDFYSKKLDEVLKGDLSKDGQDKKITTVDQSKYIELYKSELGKTIINAFTSYCMESIPACRSDGSTCLISSNEISRKEDIKTNINGLKTATFSEDEGKVWTKCITDVSKVCYEMSAQSNPDLDYSKQRACVIMDYVKSARKSLIAADEQTAFYKELAAQGAVSIASNMNVVDGDKKASSDQLTQITSADIDKKFTNLEGKSVQISSVSDSVKKEADNCDDDNQIKDKTACQKFIDTKLDKNTEAVAEFGLGQIAKEEDLNKKLENKDNVAAYLKEEGYSDPEIKKMTEQGNIEKVKDEIKKRFVNEKEAIIKEMASRIGNKTSTDDGSITGADHSKMATIKEELASKNDDLKNLIHFNNIVSSYLTVEDAKTKQSSRNTASLYAEVQNDTSKDGASLKENLKKNKDLKQNDVSSSLDVKTINDVFLKYFDSDKKSNGQ